LKRGGIHLPDFRQSLSFEHGRPGSLGAFQRNADSGGEPLPRSGRRRFPVSPFPFLYLHQLFCRFERKFGLLASSLTPPIDGSIGHDYAVTEGHDPGCVFRDVHFVRHEQNGEPALGIEPLKDLHHFDARAGIEISCGFVGQQQDRIIDQGARDCDTLLLSAGQLASFVVHSIPESNGFQRCRRTPPALGCGHPVAIEQRQFDVVQGGASRQEVESLKDKPDLMVPDVRELISRKPRNIPPIEKVLTAGRTIEAPEYVHQRRFARAGWSCECNELTGHDVERDAAKRSNRNVADDISFGQITDAEKDGTHSRCGVRRISDKRRPSRPERSNRSAFENGDVPPRLQTKTRRPAPGSRLAGKFPKQRLNADEAAVQNPFCDSQQIHHLWIRNAVKGRGPFFPGDDDACGSKPGKLLRDDRLIECEHALQVLHPHFSLDENFENANPNRVRECLEELRLQRLKFG